jgi:hypothetical protein
MPSRTRLARAIFLCGCLLPLAIPATSQVNHAGPEAREAAERWIDWLAADDFETTWEEAGELFRVGNTLEDWAVQAAAGNTQIGENLTRELLELRGVTDPPSAPPGDYVHIRYQSEFSLVGPATEIVVLMHEGERGWRVVGYFVQPPSA